VLTRKWFDFSPPTDAVHEDAETAEERDGDEEEAAASDVLDSSSATDLSAGGPAAVAAPEAAPAPPSPAPQPTHPVEEFAAQPALTPPALPPEEPEPLAAPPPAPAPLDQIGAMQQDWSSESEAEVDPLERELSAITEGRVSFY